MSKPKRQVIIEFNYSERSCLTRYHAARVGAEEARKTAQTLLDRLVGYGAEEREGALPIPMLSTTARLSKHRRFRLSTYSLPTVSADLTSESTVLSVSIDEDRLDRLAGCTNLRVWPNSSLAFFGPPIVAAPPPPPDIVGLHDCAFSEVATIDQIRTLLRADMVFNEGLDGSGIVVAVIDNGIDGQVYPVIGGTSAQDIPPPGTASSDGHGSMCAAAVLVAAPEVKLLDYPRLVTSSDATDMLQEILSKRRLDGTPHLTTNSYGFTYIPDVATSPGHEIHDINHPIHRKVREVVASGAPCFFAAGNCGQDCPSLECDMSSLGPGRSIHGSNSLSEVITVAAVNRLSRRLGYSGQGPGFFDPKKPDIAAYTQYFGHFGPNRPGGQAKPCDDGTSSATPVAAGIAALAIQAYPQIRPESIKEALLRSAWRERSTDWDPDYGHGIIDAWSVLEYLKSKIGPPPGVPLA